MVLVILFHSLVAVTTVHETHHVILILAFLVTFFLLPCSLLWCYCFPTLPLLFFWHLEKYHLRCLFSFTCIFFTWNGLPVVVNDIVLTWLCDSFFSSWSGVRFHHWYFLVDFNHEKGIFRDGSHSHLVQFFEVEKSSRFDPSRSRSQSRISIVISEALIRDPIQDPTKISLEIPLHTPFEMLLKQISLLSSLRYYCKIKKYKV